MEELLLDPLFALDELDVVDEQDVVVAVAALEPLDPGPALTDGVDELVHERLARDVARREAPRVLADVVADRLQEVRLAETGAAVDEERVVRLRRRLGDGERGRVREAIRRPDDEEVERVLRVELDICRLAVRGLCLRAAVSVPAGWVTGSVGWDAGERGKERSPTAKRDSGARRRSSPPRLAFTRSRK